MNCIRLLEPWNVESGCQNYGRWVPTIQLGKDHEMAVTLEAFFCDAHTKVTTIDDILTADAKQQIDRSLKRLGKAAAEWPTASIHWVERELMQ